LRLVAPCIADIGAASWPSLALLVAGWAGRAVASSDRFVAVPWPEAVAGELRRAGAGRLRVPDVALSTTLRAVLIALPAADFNALPAACATAAARPLLAAEPDRVAFVAVPVAFFAAVAPPPDRVVAGAAFAAVLTAVDFAVALRATDFAVTFADLDFVRSLSGADFAVAFFADFVAALAGLRFSAVLTLAGLAFDLAAFDLATVLAAVDLPAVFVAPDFTGAFAGLGFATALDGLDFVVVFDGLDFAGVLATAAREPEPAVRVPEPAAGRTAVAFLLPVDFAVAPVRAAARLDPAAAAGAPAFRPMVLRCAAADLAAALVRSAMASPRCKTGARRAAAHSRGWQEYGMYRQSTIAPHVLGPNRTT
jgi:hypothetical protein